MQKEDNRLKEGKVMTRVIGNLILIYRGLVNSNRDFLVYLV